MGRRTLLLIASILVAAAGTALVWLYAQGAESRARAGTRQVSVWVATGAINAGSGLADLTSQVVQSRSMTADDAPADRLVSLDGIGNKTAIQTILPGQVLITDQFAAPGTVAGVDDKTTAVAASMEDPNRVAALLRPESRVAVYVIETEGPRAKLGGGTSVSMLFPDVRVIAIGGTTIAVDATGAPAKVGTQSGVPTADVTLDLSSHDAARLMLAQAAGTLYFTLLGKDAAGAASDDVTTNNLLG